MVSDGVNALKVVILAGGRGKKLGGLTSNTQKCMLPVGRDQKPILEHVVHHIRGHGFREILMLLGYKHQQVENHFGDGRRFGVKIEYFVDIKPFVGPLNSLKTAYTKKLFDGDILVYHGDILSSVNLKKLVEQHREKKAVITVTVVRSQPGAPTMCFNRDMRLQPYKKMGDLCVYTPVGILTINTHFLGEIRVEEGGGLIHHALLRLANKGMPIFGYLTNKPLLDINTPSDYEKANIFVDKFR